MKAIQLITAFATIAIVVTSCKDEAKIKAVKAVGQYSSFVDSVIKLEPEIVAVDWTEVEATAEFKKSEALEALDNLEEREILDNKVDADSKKFDIYKKAVETKMEVASGTITTIPLSKKLFGIVIGKDMNFEWVNKNNILQTYQNFVDGVSTNKDNYSREDWDEVKLLYEALDNRKNTVEKEGLSSSDNVKIAALKVKFAPMYRLNRIDAKSQENADAKS
ncbi:MAG: hypothetical protein V4670_03170 [Bacteroidota bacterium]